MSTTQNNSACASQIQQDYLLALSLSCRRSPRNNGNKRPYEESAISRSATETVPVKFPRRRMVKKPASGNPNPASPSRGPIQKKGALNNLQKVGGRLEQTATTDTEKGKSTFTPATTNKLNPAAGEGSHGTSQEPLPSLTAINNFSIPDQAHALLTGETAPSNSGFPSLTLGNSPHDRALSVPTQSLSSSSFAPDIPSHHKTVENIVATIIHSYHTILLVNDPQHRLLIPATSQPYVEMASKSYLLQDKFISMRTKGPSYRAIGSALLPPPYPPCPLFFSRWMISRLFGFGHPTLIDVLGSVTTTSEVLTARDVYKNATGAGINTVPAYGSIRFNPSNVGNYISIFFAKGPAIAKYVSLQKVMPTFAAMLEVIQAEKIPYYTKGTLLSWLLVCDFAESGLVEPPTARDLATRLWIILTEGKGGRGAWRGLVKGLEGYEFANVGEVERFLENVYGGVKCYLNTQLQAQGGEYLFRPQGLWYSDIEHCLCKVVRSEKFG
ncbi:hypothetical protein HOY80DRAFT_1038272 [Tuber brumale]|nr:hypothetical protein HOY80DRAFT_1038272 [Tuber brumale]